MNIIIQVKFTCLYTLFVHYIENVQSLQFSMILFHVNESNAYFNALLSYLIQIQCIIFSKSSNGNANSMLIFGK